MATRAERRRSAVQRGGTESATSSEQQIASWIDSATEATWLLGIVLIPLIVFPDSEFISRIGIAKTTTLRFVASITIVLLMIGVTLRIVTSSTVPLWRQKIRLRSAAVETWRSERKFLLFAVLLLASSTVVSTFTSALPSISLWGDAPGNEGYGLYTHSAFWVIFLAIGLKLRSRTQYWRLLTAVAVSGGILSLAGIGQQLNVWPVRETYYLGRSTGSLGNPIALGAFILLTFPVAMSLTYLHIRPRLSSSRWIAVASVVSFLFLYSVQLTLSRGPYLGIGFAILVFVVLLWRYQGRIATVEIGGPVAIAGAVVALISLGQPVAASWLNIVDAEDAAAEPVKYDPASERTSELSTLNSRITTSSTITDRFDIWTASLDLVLDRPSVPDSRNLPPVARHIVGYGPETFGYTMPLKASSDMFDHFTSNAHNDFLHRAVENGVLGLGTFLLVLGAALRILLSSARSANRARSLVALAIFAALSGRMVEQLTGVARNSDSLIFWVLIAAVFVLPVVFEHRQEDRVSEDPRDAKSRAVGNPGARDGLVSALSVSVAFVVITIVMVIAWQKNVPYIIADHDAAVARQIASTDPDRGLELFDSAIRGAPEVRKYRSNKSELLLTQAEVALEPSERLSLQAAAYEADLGARNINSLDRYANFRLAASAWNLAQAQVPGKAEETVAIYEHLAMIAPEYKLVGDRLEQLYIATGIEPVE